jgi:hypothetical protein
MPPHIAGAPFSLPAAPEIPPKVRVEGQGQLHVGMTAW